MNENEIIQSLEMFLQIKIREIKQDYVDNLNLTIHTMDQVTQNLIDFSDTVKGRLEEIGGAQTNILARIDINATQIRKIRRDVEEIPTLIIVPLVERLLLPHEDANRIIMTNLEGMMLMMDRIPEILKNMQSISNFETLIISPITSRLSAMFEISILRGTDAINDHIISNQRTLTKKLSVITLMIDQPAWFFAAS
jgi:hypothetical protein